MYLCVFYIYIGRSRYQHFVPVRRFVERLPLLQRRWLHVPISRSNGTVPSPDRSCTLPSQPGHFPTSEGHVIANFADESAAICQQHCCANKQCTGWIFTTYQTVSTRAPCEIGRPCCWLKAGVDVSTAVSVQNAVQHFHTTEFTVFFLGYRASPELYRWLHESTCAG